jgi:transposase
VIQIVPHLKVLVAFEPVAFRKGIDSLAGVVRLQFQVDPFTGTLFVFRNRSSTALKLLVYDGQGFSSTPWPISPLASSNAASSSLNSESTA